MKDKFILNKEENEIFVKRPIKKERIIVVAAVYVAVMFFIASFITMGIALVLSLLYNADFTEVFYSFQSIEEFIDNGNITILKINSISQGLGNMIGYLLVFIIAIITLNNVFVDDFKQLINDKKSFYKWFIPVSAILFIGLTLLIDFLIGFIAPSSSNQQTIEIIMLYGGKIPMIIAVVLFAPVVEEIVYRKILFTALKSHKKYVAYIVSIFCFALPHMISTPMDNVGIFILQCIPYAFSGFLLALIYDYSGENIYASIAAHMLNNLLACILIFV